MGISMAYLQEGTFAANAELFLALQSEFLLAACEVHLEGIQFAAHYWRPDAIESAALSSIRERVGILGFHLPYLDINPVSIDPEIAAFAMNRLSRGIKIAAGAGADYVVGHVRGRSSPGSGRKSDLSRWLQIVTRLSEEAARQKIVFCLENADDLRSIEELNNLSVQSASTRICLDVGHLFERLELPGAISRTAARLWDRYLPWSAVCGKGLPFFEAEGMSGCLELLSDRLYCIHVHNHNGRLAHQPLINGKISLPGVLRQVSDDAIVILEADYRQQESGTVRRDLGLLKEWLCS